MKWQTFLDSCKNLFSPKEVKIYSLSRETSQYMRVGDRVYLRGTHQPYFNSAYYFAFVKAEIIRVKYGKRVKVALTAYPETDISHMVVVTMPASNLSFESNDLRA